MTIATSDKEGITALSDPQRQDLLHHHGPMKGSTCRQPHSPTSRLAHLDTIGGGQQGEHQAEWGLQGGFPIFRGKLPCQLQACQNVAQLVAAPKLHAHKPLLQHSMHFDARIIVWHVPAGVLLRCKSI